MKINVLSTLILTIIIEIADLGGRIGEVPRGGARNVVEASRGLKNVRRDVGDEKCRRPLVNIDHVWDAIEGGPVNLQPIQISTAKCAYPKRGVG